MKQPPPIDDMRQGYVRCMSLLREKQIIDAAHSVMMRHHTEQDTHTGAAKDCRLCARYKREVLLLVAKAAYYTGYADGYEAAEAEILRGETA